jgi:hypothetical protein
MRGRDGAERFPQATDVALDVAVTRALRELDSRITLEWVKETLEKALAPDEEVIRARNATVRARPDDPKRFFAAQFRMLVPPTPAPRPRTAPLRTAPGDDPYDF